MTHPGSHLLMENLALRAQRDAMVNFLRELCATSDARVEDGHPRGDIAERHYQRALALIDEAEGVR